MLNNKMTVSDWLKFAKTELKRCNFINNSGLEAELLLSHLLKCDRLTLQLKFANELSSRELSDLNNFLELRKQNLPISYITSSREFFGREFFIDQRVLIPRPESEFLIEQALQLPLPTTTKILDVGCGSGALGVSLFLELQKADIEPSLTLLDISQEALNVAKINADKFHVPAVFLQSDLLSNISNHYDIILANLPYVDRKWDFIHGIDYEPEIALFAKQDGLALIYELINQVVSLNKFFSQSWLLLESDPIQQPAIKNCLKKVGFSDIHQADYVTICKVPN